MKAIVRSHYGSPETLRLVETDVPSVDDDEILIKVVASSVNPYDWHATRGQPYLIRLEDGLRTPKNPAVGIDVAGTVAVIGKDVRAFKLGDEVFGRGIGALSEFALSDEKHLAYKPSELTFDSAASIPCAGVAALRGLRDKGQVREGHSVLINGASGGVGTFAVQIAKAFGASVTGVCSTKNLEFVRSIGAVDVVDYTVADFTQLGTRYDVVFDLVGNRSLRHLRRALKPEGVLVIAGGGTGKWFGPVLLMLRAKATSPFVRQQLRPLVAHVSTTDLNDLCSLYQRGQLVPVIDRTFSLSNAADAVKYVEAGHTRGKVVVVN
jgi:NADPH:quinone reductase-like Zn-dependent oxidoreductase